ncbi:MAG: 1-phosphofructokinase family hexose kinase [Thermoflexales bacterium]|nr:1-phosphofructokinase family hexose kinase [Thermoflexales bacterium]
MLLTVTPNTAIDRILRVPRLVPNRTLRSQPAVISPAGKGVCASLVAAALGYPTVALGFVAGEDGRRFVAQLRQRGVHTDFVEVEGEMRWNVVILGEEDQTHTTITAEALRVRPEHICALREKFAAHLSEARCVVLGGSVPAGVSPTLSAELVVEAKERGLPVVLDASGEVLRHGARAAPTWVKPNREELELLSGQPVHTLADALHAARRVHHMFGSNVLASLGAEGALAITATGAWRALPLPVPLANPAGAGDAMVAGLAMGLAKGWPLEESLRWAIAAASATVSFIGTAELTREAVLKLLPQVQILPL